MKGVDIINVANNPHFIFSEVLPSVIPIISTTVKTIGRTMTIHNRIISIILPAHSGFCVSVS